MQIPKFLKQVNAFFILQSENYFLTPDTSNLMVLLSKTRQSERQNQLVNCKLTSQKAYSLASEAATAQQIGHPTKKNGKIMTAETKSSSFQSSIHVKVTINS